MIVNLRLQPFVFRKDVLPARVRFGAFILDLTTGELCLAESGEGGRRILLQGQPFKVLLTLIERDREIATREEIKKKLWPNDTVVEFDHHINVVIGKLRRALSDSAQDPRYIETLARRGYRLIVPVEWISVEDSPGQGGAQVSHDTSPSVPLQPARERSLAERFRTTKYWTSLAGVAWGWCTKPKTSS